MSALHLDDSNISAVETPAIGYLPINEKGEPPLEHFNYRSVVGQLNYLSDHSRCDITMAVLQMARFVHKLKLLHDELALI